MSIFDYAIIVSYLLALLFIGFMMSKQVKNTKDLFVANGESPWWMSGISAYMTMFSSGTFVVWGGMAYKIGLPVVSILMTLGVSGLLVGYYLAGKWKELGVSSASEFIELRFGRDIVQIYTWLGILTRMLGVGVALYSICTLSCALIKLPAGSFMADPATGTLSINYAVIIAGIIIVGYTFAGGLWAVLLTDVLQFVVLMACVFLIVPLLFIRVGGINTFITSAPENFFDLTNNEFTTLFLIGWVAIHFFKIGGEWAFVQRATCVSTKRDAKKVFYLFGVLYLITPLFWMLPTMIYRVINSNINPEQAYILASREVLPVGLIGLMVAAMFSATASMADSEINVFAGAFTRDIYAKFINRTASEEKLMNIGRLATIALGVLVVFIALSIPYFGGVTTVVIVMSGMFVGPMCLPCVWGIFSKKINKMIVILTIVISGICGIILKYYLANFAFIKANMRISEVVVGVVIPLIVLAVSEILIKKEDENYKRVEKLKVYEEKAAVKTKNIFPLKVILISTILTGAFIFAVSLFYVGADYKKYIQMFSSVLIFIPLIGCMQLRKYKE